MKELEFDEAAHIYTFNNMRVPSVSEIVSPLGGEIDERLEITIEAAAERGTICHKVSEQLLTDEGEPEYPAEYECYIDAVRWFMSEHEIIPVSTETPIYSEIIGVAGTPDLLCYLDGSFAILDYKFISALTGQLKTKYGAQINGYCRIYEDNGVYPEALYVVHFRPDGQYRLYPVTIDKTDFDLCRELYTRKNRKHPKGKIE